MKESELNQRYGDHWAKTIVAKSNDVPAESKSGWEIFVLAFLMGSVGWMVLHRFGADHSCDVKTRGALRTARQRGVTAPSAD